MASLKHSKGMRVYLFIVCTVIICFVGANMVFLL